MNRFGLDDKSDNRHHHSESQNLDNAVDENTQKHQRRPLSLACIEQPVGPLKDGVNGVGFRHGGGQAGDAGKVSVTVRLGVALRFGFCWVSVMNHPSFEILSRNAPHGQHAVRAASHTRSNTGARSNPHPVFQGDVAHHQVEGGFLVVVVAAQKQGALREATVASNRDLAEVVNPHVFANPSVVAYDELPRVLDGDARLEDHAASHFGTEKAKDCTFKGAGPGEPGLEEQA